MTARDLMPYLTARNLMLFAAFGSLALIAGALTFQAFGYAPCKLCYWQRYPHWVAIAMGAWVLVLGPRAWLGMVGAMAALTTAGLGVYHTGIERKWWEGPTDCTGTEGALSGFSGDDLLSTDVPVDIVMCDEVAWALFGVSMASWNVLISLALAMLWFKGMQLAVDD